MTDEVTIRVRSSRTVATPVMSALLAVTPELIVTCSKLPVFVENIVIR